MKKHWKMIAAGLLLVVIALLVVLKMLPAKELETEFVLPVLMYHHFSESVTADTIVSPERFREQMTALKEAGYTTVTLSQVMEYVDEGTPLPEKAVLITMDDGYTSNLTVAAPILEELGMCATVFVIGIYEGETISPHTGNQLYPARFAYEDARQWVEKGVLDLQYHSYDMHQKASDGISGRDGILPLEGESETEYRAALQADAQSFVAKMTGRGHTEEVFAMAYPYGFYHEWTRQALEQAGIFVTFTVVEHSNTLRVGDRDCLWDMGRFNVTDRDDGETLVRRLGG